MIRNILLILLTLLTPAYGWSEIIFSQPNGAKEYTLQEIEYRHTKPIEKNQSLNLIWNFAPGVSYVKCGQGIGNLISKDANKIICTAKPGKYPCHVIAIITTVDYENKTHTTDAFIETFDVVYVVDFPIPPAPVVTGITKVVVLYETDNDTPESNLVLHNLRQELLKKNKKLLLLDEENDIFNLKEQGCYFMNDKNEVISRLELPVTIKGVIDALSN